MEQVEPDQPDATGTDMVAAAEAPSAAPEPDFAPEGVTFDDLTDVMGQEQPARRAGDVRPGSLDAVLDVPVRVQAVLGRARMPLSELVSMRPGFVVELDRRVGEPIDILVNDRLIARGEIVMIDGALGVTLTEIVKQDA